MKKKKRSVRLTGRSKMIKRRARATQELRSMQAPHQLQGDRPLQGELEASRPHGGQRIGPVCFLAAKRFTPYIDVRSLSIFSRWKNWTCCRI